MAEASHQTVRIARGRHRSPSEGACVMELASMLAGERFGDRPRCVDPVIGAFLRAFNDRLADRERQRLDPDAALAVGTRTTRTERIARREECLRFAGARPLPRLRITLLTRLRYGLRLDEGAGEFAARHAIASGDPEGGFALLNRLVGKGLEAPPLAGAVELGAELRVAGAGSELVLDPH